MSEVENKERESVREYYGSVLESSSDLKTSACCVEESIPQYLKPLLSNIHDEVMEKFYGCGSPLPPSLKGKRVLDLGSGSGRDCYLLAQLVGEEGSVVGVDMTDEQIEVANRHIEFHREKFGFKKSNVEFRKAYIEDLKSADIEDNSIDVIVSNCVLNLSLNKGKLFSEIFRVLKPGGELFFSDVFSAQRIPEELKKDQVLLGECLSGAMYIEDFRRILQDVGCSDFRITAEREMTISDKEIFDKIGMIDFYSMTVRAFKLDLEDRHEDYGQVAYYKGGVEESPHFFVLDELYTFKKGCPLPVCGNTADILLKSRLAPHFDVVGDRKQHFGLFDNWEDIKVKEAAIPTASSGGCC